MIVWLALKMFIYYRNLCKSVKQICVSLRNILHPVSPAGQICERWCIYLPNFRWNYESNYFLNPHFAGKIILGELKSKIFERVPLKITNMKLLLVPTYCFNYNRQVQKLRMAQYTFDKFFNVYIPNCCKVRRTLISRYYA